MYLQTNKQDDMVAVGHRVVHGGTVSKASVIDKSIISAIEDASELAPLHNPANLLGIHAAMNIFHCPQVAVFDTAFHQTMPPEAFLYAIPRKFYEEKKIRRFGMHGTSHMFLTERAAQMLGKPTSETNLIVCHLGAGSSMCAVKGGKSVDTTMGVTPLEGLVMATRSGDVDPAIPLMLMDMYNLSAHDVDNVLNKQSGLFGLCGHKDLRTIMEGMDKGDEHCKQAFDSFVYRIRKYLGAYMVTLNGKVDAVVFSAGIGENASRVRAAVCQGLQDMGVSIDAAKYVLLWMIYVLTMSRNNAAVGKQADISSQGASIRTLVVPTDEELSIAEQSLEAIATKSTKYASAA